MKHFAVLCILAWTCVTCLAQEPKLTAREAGVDPVLSLDGVALPASPLCFFGGEFDARNGMTSERNTAVTESWTFDDFDWSGGVVSAAASDFLDTGIRTPVGGDLIVYQGMSEGQFGTLMGRATECAVNVIPIEWVWNQFRLELDLGEQAFYLPPGRYHVGIRPVGTGIGQAFVCTTSGQHAVGSPIANSNCFFQSDFFGYPVPTNWENLFGPGHWDAEYRLECGGDYALNVSGECPGQLTISWNGAAPNQRQAIIYSSDVSSAPIGGLCGMIPSGLASVHLFPQTLSTGPTGARQVTGYISTQACGKYIQMVTYTGGPCVTSNVVQIH